MVDDYFKAVLIVLQDYCSKNMQVHKQRKATLHESAKYEGYFQGFFSRKYIYLVQC